MLWEQKEGAQKDWKGHGGLEKPDRVWSWSPGSNKHCHLETPDGSAGQKNKTTASNPIPAWTVGASKRHLQAETAGSGVDKRISKVPLSPSISMIP